MRRNSYYLIVILFITLLFGVKAEAATTVVSTSAQDTSGNTLYARTNSYTDLPYNSQEEIYVIANTQYEYLFTWDINQNIQLYGLSTGYYTGAAIINITVTPSHNAIYRSSPVLESSHITDGLAAYIVNYNGGTYQVLLLFDNYYITSSFLGLPTITQSFYRKSLNNSVENANFTTSISLSLNSLTKTTEPHYGGLAEVIGTMVGYAINSAQEFDDIVSLLTQIKNQDPVYYNQIISGLGTLHVDITNLINEIDLDFEDLQTVVDLFPSYRTQVLQYWQELLAMNAAQSSQAAEMESQYANQGAQSETLLNGLNSLNLPEVDSNDFNLLGQVDATQKTNFFGLISLITNNSIVTTILLIIVTGAIIGYILYGKK